MCLSISEINFKGKTVEWNSCFCVLGLVVMESPYFFLDGGLLYHGHARKFISAQGKKIIRFLQAVYLFYFILPSGLH